MSQIYLRLQSSIDLICLWPWEVVWLHVVWSVREHGQHCFTCTNRRWTVLTKDIHTINDDETWMRITSSEMRHSHNSWLDRSLWINRSGGISSQPSSWPLTMTSGSLRQHIMMMLWLRWYIIVVELLVVRVQSDNFNTADVSEMSLDRVRWMHLQIIQCHHFGWWQPVRQ
jgi:hypothetical protein